MQCVRRPLAVLSTFVVFALLAAPAHAETMLARRSPSRRT